MRSIVDLREASSSRTLVSQIEDRMTKILSDSGNVRPMLSYLISTGGKRMRPLLFVWAAKACAETTGSSLDDDSVLDVAAAFEMVHLASLVHDDIIEQSPVRRGRPAVHTVWGIHAAVLAGDYLFTRANRIALGYGMGIASLMSQAIELTCEGEIAQNGRLFQADLTEREYLSHICRKTASLIGAACQAGAIMGGGGPLLEESLLRFGVELGCAFQIADDIIDITSPGETSGKTQFNDLRRGLWTLPLIFAMKSTAGDILRKACARRSISTQDILLVKKACLEEGCIDRARQSALLLARAAESRLEPLKASDAKTALVKTARKAVNRRF
ncbi:MAG: polyprenyl synthetase family protein [Firmicutes bacterium]|nr:polyprenyl synthetase family protein [Candidatus Fermentithermobacillaceae bacterium]